MLSFRSLTANTMKVCKPPEAPCSICMINVLQYMNDIKREKLLDYGKLQSEDWWQGNEAILNEAYFKNILALSKHV